MCAVNMASGHRLCQQRQVTRRYGVQKFEADRQRLPPRRLSRSPSPGLERDRGLCLSAEKVCEVAPAAPHVRLALGGSSSCIAQSLQGQHWTEMRTSTTSRPYTDSSSLCSVTAVPCNVVVGITDFEQTHAMTGRRQGLEHKLQANTEAGSSKASAEAPHRHACNLFVEVEEALVGDTG